jgi:hypothetical protein
MPTHPPPFDLAVAHRFFAADCFNRTWVLIDKPDRTPGETEAMVLTALASLWHWTHRADLTDRNLSIGHWQVSRVYALAGQGENAMRHARRSLTFAKGSPPFYVGCAHEAVARAALVSGDTPMFDAHMREAHACCVSVDDAEERVMLEADLCALETLANGRGEG